MPQDVESQLGFLVRNPLYDTVKPYSLRFDPPDFSARHNLEIEKKRVVIQDARSFHPTIEEHGFALTSFKSEMNHADFSEHEKIENVYATELQAHLKQLFLASHVRVIDYVVRRRNPNFPIWMGEEYQSQQPAAQAHLDFAHGEARKMLKTLYGIRAEEVMQHRWQIINVWRPLKGPLFDWPLAVCDTRTFDQRRDGQVADVVYPDWAYENVLVSHHPGQQWHYFSELQEWETMLFKCTDSDMKASGPCPHASFPNPRSGTSDVPRESVESRAFVFWATMEDFPEEVGTLYGERKS